jgi:hypothetical protein
MLAAAIFAVGGPALAGDACSGTYMTSVMQPIPVPPTVALAEAPENPALADRFLGGLRAGGALLDPSSPLKLGLLFTLATRASGPLQGTVYSGFNWADQGGHLADINAASVNLTVNLVDSTSAAYVWIASAQCAIKVPDAGAVAAELGNLIGRTLGRDVQNGRF